MRIPEVRERLQTISEKLAEHALAMAELSAEQHQLIAELRRRPAVRRAPRRLPGLTDEQRDLIRRIAGEHPEANYIDICREFHHVTGQVANTGRVSEVLAGQRE